MQNIYLIRHHADNMIMRHRIPERIRSLKHVCDSAENRTRNTTNEQRSLSNCRKTQRMPLFKKKEIVKHTSFFKEGYAKREAHLVEAKQFGNANTGGQAFEIGHTYQPHVDKKETVPVRVQFKKVEQSRKQRDHPFLRNVNPQQLQILRNRSMRKVQTSPRHNILNVRSQNCFNNMSFANNQKTNQIPQNKEDDQFEDYRKIYKIQPKDRIFLCDHCFQFLPIIEIKNHLSICTVPQSQKQFIDQWQKIIGLLKELNSSQHANELQRLIDLMEWYVGRSTLTKNNNYVLYSEELNRILAYQSIVKLKFVNVQDLFWLVEHVGDMIQTRNSSELSIWNICS